MDKACKNCALWDPFDADKNWGTCHRYPQSVETSGTWWCGEFFPCLQDVDFGSRCGKPECDCY